MQMKNNGNSHYTFRHGSHKKLVSAEVLETPYPEADEQYDMVVCHYSRALIPRREAIVLGAILPTVATSFMCHPLAVEKRKWSMHAFHEHEQNCNTCRYLQRVPFNKAQRGPQGLMHGECSNDNRQPVYPQGGNKVAFHPDDCMLQPCYEGRLDEVGNDAK